MWIYGDLPNGQPAMRHLRPGESSLVWQHELCDVDWFTVSTLHWYYVFPTSPPWSAGAKQPWEWAQIAGLDRGWTTWCRSVNLPNFPWPVRCHGEFGLH